MNGSLAFGCSDTTVLAEVVILRAVALAASADVDDEVTVDPFQGQSRLIPLFVLEFLVLD
jgi:hypothetical protein